MSDETELNGTEPTVPAGTPVAAPSTGSSGDFLSTTSGKAVLIGSAAVVLLVIAGVVGWFILGPSSMGTGTPGTPTVVVPSGVTPSAPSAPATSSVVATLPVADITSRDVFTPRNPFKVIKASVIPTSTSSNSNSSGNTDADTTDPGDVILKDIITEDSVRKAVIGYGGHTYTLAAGEDIPGSDDWQVLTVHAGSAVLLFGDVSVTLTPGQGTSK